MTFLVDIVLESLGRTLSWLAAETLIALVGAAAVIAVAGTAGHLLDRRTVVAAAIAGALVAASLVDRFDLPAAFRVEIWRLGVPVVWSLAGSVVGAAALAGWSAWRQRRAE